MKSNSKNSIASYAFFALLLFLISCTSGTQKRAFSQQFYKDSGLSGNDLKNVQFYLDRDLVLYRTFNSVNSRVEGGKISLIGGEKVEEVLIRRGTKGVLVFMPKDDRLGICFDPQDEKQYLMFGPNPNNGNRYSLLASDWENGIGYVTYGSSRWKTTRSNGYASLLVDHTNIKKTTVETEIPSGREVKK